MIFLAPFGASAQDLANINGTVTDQSGAVVPAASVTVSNPDRGFMRKLVSDSQGEYTAARVPIGNYMITVEKTGFQKLVRSGITLQVGRRLRVGPATADRLRHPGSGGERERARTWKPKSARFPTW